MQATEFILDKLLVLDKGKIMKVYILTDENGYIVSVTNKNFKSSGIKIEVENYEEFLENHIYYKYLGGVLIKDESKLNLSLLNIEKSKARNIRKVQFAALDLYDKAVLRCDIGETPEMKNKRDNFRKAWLQLPNKYKNISKDIESLYPITPDFIEKFI